MVDIAHLGRPQRVAFAALLVCVSATYARVAIRRCKPGSSRLISALPVLLGNVYLPTLFRSQSDIVVCSLVCLCLLWLCNLKVLAMCYERGPLCQSRSALQFLTIFALPVTPREKAVDGMPCEICAKLYFVILVSTLV